MGKKGGGRVRVKQVGPKMPPNMNPLADLAIPPEDMIHLPTRPDSNSGFMFWPMGETLTMSYKQFSAIYPNYLDSNKTSKLGRRIAAKYAVSEPTIQDIHEGLVALNIRHVIQPHKGYSRDASSRWYNSGRVLVDLEGAANDGILGMHGDGSFDLDDDIPEMGDEENDKQQENNQQTCGAKKRLLLQLALRIRELPNRLKRLEEAEKMSKEEEQKSVVEKTKPVGMSGGTSNRKKKGGKKKK
ncbi:predicted protein [Thalassiosira pseudonana CCMP1335]|uniref:Uncharacterized protein n=1 Tax=Thalassiosira pseudonana TaxID=35128 RepID=B8BZP9_THAPS|nr:predicted protein [Thalassiosira pseudonana CCMP1335]EED92921.1 predicted protein [Thalassiosira pseudonana CCMP1335]|mmetsp:Transcript_20424/g.44078  ORF Transcript_20424/g.44078 Transcript_20424/m.44078 type:complete len:242 (+) Transcript_20424:295-1020(+)|eukprot:g12046.t1 g12046   contig6:1109202-1110006(-)